MNDFLFFLKKNGLFSGLSEAELLSLSPFVHAETYEEGKWIFKEGDLGQHLYIIKTGYVEVVKKDKDHQREKAAFASSS